MSQEYAKWTHGLYLYFTQNVPAGSEIYLSVNKETFTNLGPRLFDAPHPNWEEHFIYSVKDYLNKNGKLNISKLEYKWLKSTGQTICPLAVGYLCLMVLAANRMQREENVSEQAYFIRLREVLNLKKEQNGRPKEMKTETEERLWEQWNAWIESEGWLSTALAGTGSHKYIQYPISQSLLREGDKDRLLHEFKFHLKDGSLRKNWDAEHLAHWLNRNSRITRKVKLILENQQNTRYYALIEAIYEIYLSLSTGGTGHLEQDSRVARNLSAGLWRYSHPVKETVTYYPYPKQARHNNASEQLHFKSLEHQLHQERTGWFQPLPIAVRDPAKSQEWELDRSSEFKKLILPGSEFWLLVRDPDDPESSDWATWHRPQAGEHFMLLCKAKYQTEMERLLGLKLIDWSDVFEVPELEGDWLEYENCMVTNLDWEGVFSANSDLFDALYPHLQISISLSGGLRLPNHEGWLVSHPPVLRVKGSNTNLNIEVYKYQQSTEQGVHKELVLKRSLATNENFNLEDLKPGRYLIEASQSQLNYRARRNLLLHDWSALKKSLPPKELFTKLPSDYKMQGAWIGGLV